MRAAPLPILAIVACVFLSGGCGGAGFASGGHDPDPESSARDVSYSCSILVSNQTQHTYDSYNWRQSSAPAVGFDPPLGPGATRTIVMEGTRLCVAEVGSCSWGWTFFFSEETTGRPSPDYPVGVSEGCETSTIDITGAWETHTCQVTFVNDTDVIFDRCHWRAYEWGDPWERRELDPPLGPAEQTSLLVSVETFVGGPQDEPGRNDVTVVFGNSAGLELGQGWGDTVVSPCQADLAHIEIPLFAASR